MVTKTTRQGEKKSWGLCAEGELILSREHHRRTFEKRKMAGKLGPSEEETKTKAITRTLRDLRLVRRHGVALT